MFHSKIVPAAVAAILALGTAGLAHAEREHRDRDEIAPVLAAKTTLAQAVAAAEGKTGGRALKIEVEDHGGKPMYEVRILADKKVSELYIDPASGQVTDTKEKGLLQRLFDRDDREEMAEMASAPTTLGAAIATAERKTGGKAVEARTGNAEGIVYFRVEVAKDKALENVTVDSNGQIAHVAAAAQDEDDDGGHHHHGRDHERGEHERSHHDED